MKQENRLRLWNNSGHVTIPARDVLTNFFYLLLRDAAPAGVVEQIMNEVESDPIEGDNEYTNGWLARYAQNLASRLRKTASQ